MGSVEFRIAGSPNPIDIQDLVIAGWTGRDSVAVERHISELEAIGVARPQATPVFYRVGKNLLSTADCHDVMGAGSTGEVETVLISISEGIFIGVGSDHTDRQVERYDVAVSKQMCPKPIGPELWALSDVHSHWDQLQLRSWVTCSGTRRLYQEGRMVSILPPLELIREYEKCDEGLKPGTVMFTGTLPVIGELSGGELFEMELHDPVGGRRLTHEYRTRCLPSSV